MSDLVYWVAQNPPPAHFLLITGDKGFANILHRLQMSNYNVLLSCPDVGSKMLHSAATFLWPWEALVKGVDLKPKYLNQPPDGLKSSWYGQYSEYGYDLLLKPKNPMALPQNTKEPEVPKSVVIGIKKVLRFYPEGISVPDLRAELKRINVIFYEGFFGFRKFSALLKAIPDVVKFIDPMPGDNQPAVVGVSKRSVESSEQISFDRMDSAQSSIEEKVKEVSYQDVMSSFPHQSYHHARKTKLWKLKPHHPLQINLETKAKLLGLINARRHLLTVWKLVLLRLGMFHPYVLMQHLETKGMPWLLISLHKQKDQPAVWKMIRWMLLALPHQQCKAMLATKGGYLNDYHLYGMA